MRKGELDLSELQKSSENFGDYHIHLSPVVLSLYVFIHIVSRVA